jgi:hypothetical protein
MIRDHLILCVLIGLLGCKSTPPPETRASGEFQEQAIYAALKKEPVPIPQSTLYGSDVRQQRFFAEGFRSGWERAISGALLHGTFGTPVDLPVDGREAWTAGCKSGTKMGSDRWQAERQKLREGIGQPDAAGNSRPAPR